MSSSREPSDNKKPAIERPIRNDIHCAAVRSGVTDLCYCLTPNPENCEYCEPFRNHYFCFHPDRLKLADRTIGRK